jgi:steroid 5-alpha reductase family enzyme
VPVATDEEIQFWRGTTWVVTAYFLAFLVGALVGRTTGASDPLMVALWADIAATLAIFVFSFAFQNSSFYDAYWSVVPIGIVGWWVVEAGADGDPTRQALVLAGVAFWGTRLTANWLSGWQGLHHEDWRYVDLQQQTGRLYWLVSLAGLHMFPTLIVFAGLWSAWVAVTSATPVSWLDALAAIVVFGAVLLEATADLQMRRWRASGPAPEACIDTGLWRYSRHPNYLGEIGFWAGLWLHAMAADPSRWATVVGPLSMALLFRFVSIPLMEARMLRKRPAYAEQIATTSMLFLWPPRRKAPEAG